MNKLLMFVLILLGAALILSCGDSTFIEKELVGEDYAIRDFETYTGNAKAGSDVDQKSYQDFINALFIRETTIDPALWGYYDLYYNTEKVTYQTVTAPGRVIRDNNGDPVTKKMTFAEYFTVLGINHLYTRGSTNLGMFRNMQNATINFLGFFGFQFSEQDLWVLGYYQHYDANGLPQYYVDFPNSTWANGVHNIYYFDDKDTLIHATDVNTWSGTWNNKHGINSFQDALDPNKQMFIITDHFQLKHDNIVNLLSETPGAKPLDEYIGTSVYWSKLTPRVNPPPPPAGRSDQVTLTMSGLLAGAHLRGAQGVIDLIVYHKNDADEIGTYILEYVQDYGGYATPWSGERSSEDAQ